MAPTTTARWTIRSTDGLDGLQLEESYPIPPLNDTECLVQIAAVSLKYRDVALATGKYPRPSSKDVMVPTSDGAGTVIAVGRNVTQHRIGDNVCPLFNQAYLTGRMKPSYRQFNLGSNVDGPLRSYAVYDENLMVTAPRNLSLIEAATLPCAANTAWNAVSGMVDRRVREGDFVLTQGTGGVSLFAAQFALAMGATVIATTSSDRKADELKKMGVQHVINYKTNPNWGEEAKAISGGEGVDHIVEVGGEATIAQSFAAIRSEGVISLIGYLGGMDKPEKQAGFNECFRAGAIMRSVFVGPKDRFIAMNRFIEDKNIKPIVDKRVFDFEQAKEAFEYLEEQNHFGKVVITVREPKKDY